MLNFIRENKMKKRKAPFMGGITDPAESWDSCEPDEILLGYPLYVVLHFTLKVLLFFTSKLQSPFSQI